MCNLEDIKTNISNYNNFTRDQVKNGYSERLTRFVNRYNRIIFDAYNYLSTYNIQKKTVDYYLFIYQLFRDTNFVNIYYLSQSTSHDYSKERNNPYFDSHIMFDTRLFKETVENKDDKQNIKILHKGICYDEELDYYLNYLTKIYGTFLSPLLCRSIHNTYETLAPIDLALSTLRYSFDVCVNYISTNKNIDRKELIDRVLKLINSFVTDKMLLKIDKIMSSPIIGNDFQNICFFLLQSIYKDNNQPLDEL